MNVTRDRNGATVQQRSKVRVIRVRGSVLARLSPEEAERVQSMEGEVLEVYEVDAWKSAWVKKWWGLETSKPVCHSLALTSEEMEVVS